MRSRGSAGLAAAAALFAAGCAGSAPVAVAPPGDTSGPAADYPILLGPAYTIDGVEYVPADTLNYDEVGRATIDAGAPAGATVTHPTLPLPSYVEVTSLENGSTILARVERRGPPRRDRLVALSPDAAQQLSLADGQGVRVRRVNPPEVERADLRAGRTVARRMDTPTALVAVLRRGLPDTSSIPPIQPSKARVGEGERPTAGAREANTNYALDPLPQD